MHQMAVTSQFSLSLELTRLVPFSIITDKAVQLVMGLARDLQVMTQVSSLINEALTI